MTQYVEMQTRKVISSYGGVGSIIETPKGAMKICSFDKWRFFQEDLHKESGYHIKDNRLLKRLQFEKGFPRLKEIVKVPPNIGQYKYPTKPENETKSISASYFPEWFYCNNCKRFNNIKTWWDNWKNTFKGSPEYKRGSFFSSPKCGHCYKEAEKKGKRKKFYELEQVRFILTSNEGNIKDIPWDRWPGAEKLTKEENSDGGAIRFDFANYCCENPDLRYEKSKKFSDLAGISIKCNNCKKRNTLSGLWGLRLSVYGKEEVFTKPVIRTANSVYYPILISSIFLPAEREIDPDDEKDIETWHNDGEDIEFIYKALKKKYSEEKIERSINSKKSDEFEPEIEYRLKEFKFITHPERNIYPADNKETDDLHFERQQIQPDNKFGVSNLTILKRVKITTVQIGYTRQEPLDIDAFLSGVAEASETNKIKPKYTSKWEKQTEYLPAIESFGEGIFISFDNKAIEKWIEQTLNKGDALKRIRTIADNIKKNDFIPKDKLYNDKILAKFILIHTISHILIKEFEFIAGYPATSLNERLYVNEKEMSGLMIYTVAGGEGSYGGLITQGNDETFFKIFESALFRALDCASDPICYHSIQGVGGLNMAACYSCSLLPETSCEEFNGFLDRALLIDNDFGFFKQIIY